MFSELSKSYGSDISWFEIASAEGVEAHIVGYNPDDYLNAGLHYSSFNTFLKELFMSSHFFLNLFKSVLICYLIGFLTICQPALSQAQINAVPGSMVEALSEHDLSRLKDEIISLKEFFNKKSPATSDCSIYEYEFDGDFFQGLYDAVFMFDTANTIMEVFTAVVTFIFAATATIVAFKVLAIALTITIFTSILTGAGLDWLLDYTETGAHLTVEWCGINTDTKVHFEPIVPDMVDIEKHYIGEGPYYGCENPSPTPKDIFQVGENVVAYNYVTGCQKDDTSHMIWQAPDGTSTRVDNMLIDYNGDWCLYTGTIPEKSGQWSVDFYYNNQKQYTDTFIVEEPVIILKPLIYLYPEEKMDVTVLLDYQGEIFADYPPYDDVLGGWQVTAFPDGRLINQADEQEYSYLFWEGLPDQPVFWDLSKGFIVKGEEVRGFLQEKLNFLGLIPREYNEFIVYWYPLLKDNPYNLIHFADDQYTSIAPLTTDPEADSTLRVFMVCKPLQEPITLPEQLLQPFDRHGFSVVEWGGTLLLE